MTDLSIIIVTYKGWTRVEKCLSSISDFTNARYSKEVIIIDNTPNQDEILHIKNKFTDFKYLHNPVNGGYGYAVNKGENISSGKFILILNPDTVATEEAIDSMIDYAVKSPAGIISCRQVNETGKECIVAAEFPRFLNLTGLMRFIFNRRRDRSQTCLYSDNHSNPDWVSGSVMLVNRDLFNQLKGFDEDFWMYFEDVDLCRRAHYAGAPVFLLKDVVIEHNHGGSSRTDSRTASLTKTEVHISRHVYISKHKKGMNCTGIQSFLVVNTLVTSLLAAIPGLIFFFIPRLFVRTSIFTRLLRYYLYSLLNSTWVSPLSVNYKK